MSSNHPHRLPLIPIEFRNLHRGERTTANPTLDVPEGTAEMDDPLFEELRRVYPQPC